MLNIKYYKDLNHNYLIIKEKLREEEQSYQHKMITTNRMKHILDCKIRYVDEECHFYYEISSRQSITSLYSNRKWGYEQLYCFFKSMREALEELENYLLDSRRLVLQPDYIYAEPEAEEYFFLYYPYYVEEEEITTQMSLAQFLIEKVDHTQDDAVAIVYKVYEMEQDHQFILSEIMSLFSQKESEKELESESKPVEDEYMTCMSEKDIQDIAEWNGKPAENNEHKEVMPKHLLAAGVLMILCIIAGIGIFVIRSFYLLSVEENLFSIVGIAFFTVTAAVLFLYLNFNLWSNKRKVSNAQDDKSFSFVTKQEESLVTASNPSVDHKETEYGNTIFLEDMMYQKENKLYGTNKGNKYHIDLEHLPCTIGKMAGSVDVVIKDSTISRIHARFTRQEEGICVTDMNSTNGTFKNGLRLEPNETVYIEPGDELRFGRMTFSYR